MTNQGIMDRCKNVFSHCGQLLAIVALHFVALMAPANAQTVSHIVGFEAVKDLEVDTYTFCPVCEDNDLKTKHLCSPSELRSYLFEWKFGEGDYSLGASPKRSFVAGRSTEQTVSLRVTGIKEERKGECISDPTCTTTYRTSLPPSKWEVVHESTQTLKLVTVADLSQPIVADQYFSRCFSDATGLAVCIGHPYCKPLWGAEIVYPIVFYNPTDCAYDVDAAVTDHVQQWTDGRWVEDIVECEDFLPNPSLTCPRPSTHPNLVFSIAPHSSVVVLTNHHIMEQTDELDSTKHELIVDATCRLGQNAPLNCTDQTLRATHQDTIVVTIDPNKKWIADRQRVYRAGEFIRFAIQFKNSGSAEEALVYVEDPLDMRLDISKAEFLTGYIVGPDRHTTIKKTQVTENKLAGETCHVYQMQFKSHGFSLGPDDSGTVLFRVPVLEEERSGFPTWLMVADTSYDTLENRGYTMFSSEGIVYETEPVHFVIAQARWRIGTASWLLGMFAIVLLAAIPLGILIRKRKK